MASAKTIQELPTPSFIVDINALKRNTQRMLDNAKELGVSVRPHMKTAKTVQGAEYMTANTPKEKAAITVSTIAEAKYYANAGFQDILYAIPIVTSKIPEVALLSSKIKRLSLFVDNEVHIKSLIQYKLENPSTSPARWSVYVKINAGNNRAGIEIGDPKSLDFVRYVAVENKDHIDFMGIYAHSGHAYRSRNTEEIKAVALQEAELLSNFAQKLRDEKGVICPFVSIGSTPACSVLATAVKESLARGGKGIGLVNEIHPGNYVFYDLMQVEMGSCEYNDIAVSVVCKVVGHYPNRNMFLVDAGSLALFSDLGCHHLVAPGSQTTACIPHPYVVGYGCIAGDSNLRVLGVTQELGKIEGVNGTKIDFSKYPIGSTVRIFPNHSCLTAALYSTYYIVDNENVVDEWHPVKGWL
eukprot:TRINITY_DN4472_c0_g1_i2.p1 TRINITY_DN4472_c0_g1~~TRINITY_DN4472_c0_g1_i2.p1  ORF type:complete len:433 (+),score=88.42 TRINITY_DN4472_c0_g1_i2:64-1299(+)